MTKHRSPLAPELPSLRPSMSRRSLLGGAGALAAAALLPQLSPQLGLLGAARAQDEVTAATVASRVQTFYDQTHGLRVNFQQHYWSSAYRRTTTSRGRLAISRPGRIRFDYTSPSGKVVVSDGSSFTYYEPGEEGESGQYWRGSADGTSSALGFLTGTARLDRDYTYTLVARRDGDPANADVLELTPRTADPHVARIRLYVSNNASTLGVVLRVSVGDHDGNWNRFDFSGFDFPDSIADSTFAYSPPEGAREITPPAGE
jgi:outer membrane lipoprotein carrier protein